MLSPTRSSAAKWRIPSYRQTANGQLSTNHFHVIRHSRAVALAHVVQNYHLGAAFAQGKDGMVPDIASRAGDEVSRLWPL
jgi:hypothetical protein